MQANILRRALVLFAEKGYDGVSIRNISASAGVTLAGIYHYFPDKQALYDAAVQHAFAYMMQNMVTAAQSDLTGEARLRVFLDRLVKLQTVESPEVRLVDRELLEARPTTMAKLADSLFQRPHDALVEIIREIAPHAPASEMAEHVIAVTYGAVKLRFLRVHIQGLARLGEPAGIAESVAEFTLAALRDIEASAARG